MSHDVFVAIRDVLVGAALLYFKFLLNRMERDQAAHKREIETKLGTGDVQSRAATAGQANGVDKHPDAHPHRGNRNRPRGDPD